MSDTYSVNEACGFDGCDVAGPHVHASRYDQPIGIYDVAAVHNWHPDDDAAIEHFDPDSINQLKEWWIEQARVEADKLAPKAVEYGSFDLELIGRVLARMTSSTTPDLEQGLVFYLLGKIARAASAVADGHRAADDTFTDIAIYARMVLYVRQFGQWP